MPRVKRRKWLAAILDDVAEGTCSVLEHAYLAQVERAHGLPRGLRQVASSRPDGSRVFRDVLYGGSRPRWRQIVELDGRLHSASVAARDADLERDLDAALDDVPTVRLGYGQVVGRPCQTAWKNAQLLRQRGWRGRVKRCADCPENAYWVGLDQPG